MTTKSRDFDRLDDARRRTRFGRNKMAWLEATIFFLFSSFLSLGAILGCTFHFSTWMHEFKIFIFLS